MKGCRGSHHVKGVYKLFDSLGASSIILSIIIELAPSESNGYYMYIAVLDYSTITVALRAVSTSGQLDDPFAHAQAKSTHYEYN